MALSNENKEFIVKNSHEHTIKEMAEILGVEERKIRSFCDRHKLNFLRERETSHKFDFTPTDREEDVIELLMQGLNKKQVAEKLIVGHSTVRTHITNIFQKFDYHTVAELVAKEWQKKIKKDYVEKSKVFTALKMLKNVNNVAEAKELVEIITNKIEKF